MKKVNKNIFDLVISAFILILLMVPIFYNSSIYSVNSINHLEKSSDGLYIYSLEDLVNGANSLNKQNYTIILKDDIDLSNLTQDDLDTLKSINQIKEIDGNGYSFYNKPKDLYFSPLFGTSIGIKVNPSSNLYVHNLTLNNAPVLFANIETYATWNSITSDN